MAHFLSIKFKKNSNYHKSEIQADYLVKIECYRSAEKVRKLKSYRHKLVLINKTESHSVKNMDKETQSSKREAQQGCLEKFYFVFYSEKQNNSYEKIERKICAPKR